VIGGTRPQSSRQGRLDCVPEHGIRIGVETHTRAAVAPFASAQTICKGILTLGLFGPLQYRLRTRIRMRHAHRANPSKDDIANLPAPDA
jgi:hypothetical protein